jgi:hypothetical protein
MKAKSKDISVLGDFYKLNDNHIWRTDISVFSLTSISWIKMHFPHSLLQIQVSCILAN